MKSIVSYSHHWWASGLFLSDDVPRDLHGYELALGLSQDPYSPVFVPLTWAPYVRIARELLCDVWQEERPHRGSTVRRGRAALAVTVKSRRGMLVFPAF